MTRRFSERQAYLLLAALAIALFADVIVAGAGFHFRDIPRLYVPGDRVIHDVIAGGEFPLWNPRWSNGQPLAANPGFSVFYPILLLLFLFSFARGFAMQIVVSYVIAATGMFALLRSRDVSVFGAFFGAVIYGFGGMLASYSDLLPFLYAASLLPWVGFFFTRYVDNPNRRDFAASALVLGCLLLTGEQSVILQIGALLSLYAILKRRPIALTIIAAAVLVAAVQLFPAIDFQRDTPRAIGLPYATATFWSVPKARFLELFFPDLFGRWASDAPQYWGSRFLRRFPSPFTSNIYASLAAAIFFAAGIARRIRGWSFAASVALISYLLALGENGPLFPLLYRAGFHSLRYPEKFLTSTIFIFSVFAAIVADRAVADDTSRKTSARIAAVVAAITIASLILISTPLGANLFGAIFQRGGAALAAARSGWMVMTI
ncbi:MAG: hypothetical protein QOE68_1329, partial [Thermoanaerobaculia bacterium]|nr:hypothetical protein [Thermoanaerobaculia bacterium]